MRGQQGKVCLIFESTKNIATNHVPESSRNLDSSLKRHTALTKRMRQSVGTENHDQILKDIESLSLEKYIDEMSGAVVEGVGRCKTEKDVWSAVEVRIRCISRTSRFTGYMLDHLGIAPSIPHYLYTCLEFWS